MPLCAVPGCKKSGVHLFPKGPAIRRKWEKAIRRKNFTATNSSRLCRDHFQQSDYVGESAYTGRQQQCKHLKKGVVPSIFPWTKQSTSPTSRSLRYEERSRRTIDFNVNGRPQDDCMPGTSAMNIPEPNNEVEILSPINESPDNQQFHKTVACQTGTSCGIISFDVLKNNNDALHYYTGVENCDKFELILNTLRPMCYNLTYRDSRVINVSIHDQLVLTLMKLRRYLPDFELAFLFGISRTNVSNICITWINFMYEIWSMIDIWPDKGLVKYFMSEAFKRDFSSTRVIVDTTEIPIAKPSNPRAQQATFSNYKHRNTLKSMIGLTPGGLISHVSHCYGGSVSDRQIIERSSLVNLCERGDSIMADRGFNVQDMFAPRDIKVNIPTFLKGKSQVPAAQVIHDRNLASKRVHVERIIGLAKTFKILKTELVSYYVPLASRILFVCAMICNFRENIMQNKIKK